MAALEIKNVILLGGTSITGQRFVEYLTTIDNPFNVTITSRSTSFPPWVPKEPSKYKIANVDYSAHESLLSAMTGQDAAISCFGVATLPLQNKAVDAAVEAGVKIFIPSEYAETSGVKVQQPFSQDTEFALSIPLFKYVHDNWKHLDDKVKAGQIYSISMSNGLFLEWGLLNGFLGFDIANKKATIYNNGETPVDAITTNKVGEAMVRILLNPKPYLNRVVHLSGLFYTQNDLLRLFEEKTGTKWTVEKTTSAESIEQGAKMLETDPIGAAYPIILGMAYTGDDAFTRGQIKNDLEEVGVEPDNLEKVVEAVLENAKHA